MCGGVEFENKEIVAENAAQLINDYTKGEVQKNLAEGSLKVAKINNETDQLVAQLDARTATVTNLPMFLVDEICATKCGRPDWTNKSILAENVARMFFEHAKAEVDLVIENELVTEFVFKYCANHEEMFPAVVSGELFICICSFLNY